MCLAFGVAVAAQVNRRATYQQAKTLDHQSDPERRAYFKERADWIPLLPTGMVVCIYTGSCAIVGYKWSVVAGHLEH